MTTFTALYDACVLFPFELRDTLIRLARTGLFRAKWTERIHDEWIRSLLARCSEAKRAEMAKSLARSREAMNRAVPDCMVDGYEDLIPVLTLPDEDDRHVLAAAIRGRADVIVTANLKHFPESALEQYGIEARHPDVFVTNCIDLDLEAVCLALKEQREDYVRRPMTADELLDCLAKQGLRDSMAALRQHIADL
jgi:predicted nucleic acid-binding protein